MKYNEEELLAKAKKPLQAASALHSYYKGKIAVTPKCRVKDLRDFDFIPAPNFNAHVENGNRRGSSELREKSDH